MDLGVRHIRTAGKGSGSIELTLPAGLRDLVGLACRITLRDGSRPDIVLQPDLQPAHAVFAAMWDAMAAILLRHDGFAPPFHPAGFGLGLQPRAGAGEQPFLCWRDGLALAAAEAAADGPAAAEPVAISRILAAFGHAMAADLHVAAPLAAGFGAACGTLATGVAPQVDGQEACDLAAAALCASVRPGGALAAAQGRVGAEFWRHAAPALTAAAELFAGWTANPSGHATLRLAWRRGRSIEMGRG